MAFSTIDQQACGPFSVGHSIQDHLDAERAVLIAEWQVAARSGGRDRWMMLRAAGLGLALAGTIAIGWRQTHPTDDRSPACTAVAPDAAAATTTTC